MKSRQRLIIFVVLGLSLFYSGASSAPQRQVWLAVTREMFVDALEPLRELREQQGFQAVISTKSPAEAVSENQASLRYILLVGDEQEPGVAASDPNADVINAPWRVPTRWYEATRWHNGQDETFASDAVLGDVDGDGVMDIPVGRLPVRTTQQLQTIIAKIIGYEQRGPRLTDLTFPLWTGKAEYGEVIDRFTTTVLLENLNTLAPDWCQPWVISANESHALCGWPFNQAKLFARKVKEEGAVAVLMGHGWLERFYSMTFDFQRIYFSIGDVREYWSNGDPTCPLIIIACYCGDFTNAKMSIAETALSAPGGPVAVIGGTAETHPLTNLYGGQALLRQMHQGHERIGDYWRAVQEETFATRIPLAELLLGQIEGQFKEPEGVDKVRYDHQRIYALLGDPATKLYIPRKLHGRIDREDNGWRWRVDKPEGAECLLVDWRESRIEFSQANQLTDAWKAHQRFEQANAGFAFERLATRSAGEEWSGIVDKPGLLRFIAVGKDKLYTAGVVIAMPASKP